jgi:hypothetical protein
MYEDKNHKKRRYITLTLSHQLPPRPSPTPPTPSAAVGNDAWAKTRWIVAAVSPQHDGKFQGGDGFDWTMPTAGADGRRQIFNTESCPSGEKEAELVRGPWGLSRVVVSCLS